MCSAAGLILAVFLAELVAFFLVDATARACVRWARHYGELSRGEHDHP